jgi:diketogulonate reductase-like aldo/keto reductase
MFQSLKDGYALHNGVRIPCIGLGTWQTQDGQTAVDAVKAALALGYRHIDTAAAYGNERSVGEGIRRSGVARGDIFVTSKLHNAEHGYGKTKAAFERTMESLGLDYLDLYLIHWPNPVAFRGNWREANAGSWKAFEEFYGAGRIRAIGVSNFRPHHLDALLETASVEPMVNQIRICPGDTTDETVAYCREHDILPEAYSPFGTGKIFNVPEMREIALKYGKSVAQVCIRWSLQMGFLPLPKSTNEARIRENADVFDFELSERDVRTIAGLKGCCGYSSDPDKITW